MSINSGCVLVCESCGKELLQEDGKQLGARRTDDVLQEARSQEWVAKREGFEVYCKCEGCKG